MRHGSTGIEEGPPDRWLRTHPAATLRQPPERARSDAWRFRARSSPIPTDDQAIRRALADAHLPSLLPALAQITGDHSLLREDLMPDTIVAAAEQGGLSREAQARVRELALETLIAWRDRGGIVSPRPSPEGVRGMMDYMLGTQVSDEYIPLLLEELAFADEDARAPTWRKDEIDAGREFRAVIIGAGMSGILAAIRLKQAGVPFVVVEKNADVGGTWFENTYPGARVDSSNHAYSYSFAQKLDWPYHHSTQEVLLKYFRDCAEEFGVLGDIRFSTEVVSAEFDEARCAWAVKVRGGAGGEETIDCEALISAVGQLNRPQVPGLPRHRQLRRAVVPLGRSGTTISTSAARPWP